MPENTQAQGSELSAKLGGELCRPLTERETYILGGPPRPEDFGLLGKEADIARSYGDALIDWFKITHDSA